MQATNWEHINLVKNNLVVSCQASPGDPLYDKEHINALALSAIIGGAKGLRLEGIQNIEYVRKHTKLPIIGLIKSNNVSESERLSKVYITATIDDVRALAASGADAVALDATPRARPDNSSLKRLIEIIHSEYNKPVWADIATVEEALMALELGADVISTTLYGYTEETSLSSSAPPDFELVSKLCALSSCPVVLEGRIWCPSEVKKAFECGVWSVVVGSAITRPQVITSRFIEAIPKPTKLV